MDSDAERKKLEDEKAYILGWRNHPISLQVFEDSKNEQHALIELITNNPINSFEAFFAHFEAVGHLRGLRRAEAIVKDKLEEVQEQLKDTQDGN